MKIKAHGILKHHFWGAYSATIGLEFKSEAHALDALLVLGDVWSQGKESKNVLLFHGGKEELTKVEQMLIRYGADPEKLTSLAKSIDYGEPFEIEIPITPVEQTTLF